MHCQIVIEMHGFLFIELSKHVDQIEVDSNFITYHALWYMGITEKVVLGE